MMLSGFLLNLFKKYKILNLIKQSNLSWMCLIIFPHLSWASVGCSDEFKDTTPSNPSEHSKVIAETNEETNGTKNSLAKSNPHQLFQDSNNSSKIDSITQNAISSISKDLLDIEPITWRGDESNHFDNYPPSEILFDNLINDRDLKKTLKKTTSTTKSRTRSKNCSTQYHRRQIF